MVRDGGHSNYNASMIVGSKRSVTYPVSKMPFELQRKVFVEVLDLIFQLYFDPKCFSLVEQEEWE